ncbi:MAG: hypothetical protein EZS28_006694 [Streblomastix strix]|uniref:NrS-1 polymerase-like helicase domain-containing protein n=1 Tax=Streblomastix strix TaxID=222440 RepID=A0A5J4WSA1_9EUKA|nr:MAG: hypothetical protein EZS28_006694 [Streblomastix strix]
MASLEFSINILTQLNFRSITLHNGPKHKYICKSKTNEKTKAINEQSNEQSNEQDNEQVNQQDNQYVNEKNIVEDSGINANRQIIEQRQNQHISDLRNQYGGTDKEQYDRHYLIYRLEKNREDNIFQEIMQPLVDLYRQEQNIKTIIERDKDVMINTVNYTKIGQYQDNGTDNLKAKTEDSGVNAKKQQITGRLIDLSLMKEDNLCVIDFNINKKLPIEEIDKIRQSIIDNMLPANVALVKTAHGGLHAYCNRNCCLLPSNRNVKVITRDNFDIDIFAQMNKYKIENGQETKELVQNRIVAPNTTIRETKNNVRQIFKYEAINDWDNASHLASLRQILDQWNVDIEMSYQDYIQQQHDRKYGVQINEDGTIDKMNDELALAYIDNLKSLDIHNYLQPINMEVSLLSLFCGLYGIGKNVFINVLCELLAGYSSKNITDIDDFIGRFNTAIENKMLAIANDMKNFGESRISNMDALKSINTESSFMINQKCIPKHEVENVVNIIMVTNNVIPLQIETNDRRYVVSRDISQFNPRDIPLTQAKKDII